MDDRKIGAYSRNYPSLFDTFVPFVQEDEVYALYLPNHLSLKEAVNLDGYEEECGEVEFTLMRRFSLTMGEWLNEPT